MTWPRLIPINELRIGDSVDLENDPFVDPVSEQCGDGSDFHEYLVVDSIDTGSGGEFIVGFDQLLCVFPENHALMVDRGMVS